MCEGVSCGGYNGRQLVMVAGRKRNKHGSNGRQWGVVQNKRHDLITHPTCVKKKCSGWG